LSGSCGRLVLAVVFYIMWSRVQVILYLAVVFYFFRLLYSLQSSSIPCGRLRFLAVVFDFLQSSGSSGRRVLASSGSCGGWVLVVVFISCGPLLFLGVVQFLRSVSLSQWSVSLLPPQLLVSLWPLAIIGFSLASLGHWFLLRHGWLLVFRWLSRLHSWLSCSSLLRSLICQQCCLLPLIFFVLLLPPLVLLL